MITEDAIREKLEDVLVPGVMRSVEKLNLVRQISIADGKVGIDIASAALDPGAQDWIKSKTLDVIGGLPEVKEVDISFVTATPKEVNKIGQVIAIASGKGGVGKSLVTGLLALSLERHGSEVGILDADITGPSIPKMFGITGHPMGMDNTILPLLSRRGIEIMSMNLLLPHEDDAVIWRGPLIAKAITQFWEDVLWGKLDYLLVDLPPGTADVPLTVMQSLPVSGLVIVSSPQELASMVVRKAVQMAQKMNVPILGVVENMSYFTLPDTGKRIEIFGKSRADEMAKAAGAPLLGQIPIDPQLAQLCDDGDIELYDSELLDNFAKVIM
ncbi:MAG: Mrp/NBP35 family ATP-binding protein [Chloroflexota bacterium]|nr:Mrp/NBP35 family ATP-binding protein [Chloroflexota bacterium]